MLEEIEEREDDEIKALGDVEEVEEEIKHVANVMTQVKDEQSVSVSSMESMTTALPFEWEDKKHPLATYTKHPSQQNLNVSLEAGGVILTFLFKGYLYFMATYLLFRLGFFLSDKLFERLDALIGLGQDAKSSNEKYNELVDSVSRSIKDKVKLKRFKEKTDNVEVQANDLMSK